MTEENTEKDIKEHLDKAMRAFGPPEKVENLDPDYPPDYTPEDRIQHVVSNEFPRWRGFEWIRVASNTCEKNCSSILNEMLSHGEIEISDEGIRRNRYFVMYERVDKLTERASDRPNWL